MCFVFHVMCTCRFYLCTVSARFATLAWSEMANKQAEYPYGLVAGGMGDGTVSVWDPAKLVASHPQPEVHWFFVMWCAEQ